MEDEAGSRRHGSPRPPEDRVVEPWALALLVGAIAAAVLSLFVVLVVVRGLG